MAIYYLKQGPYPRTSSREPDLTLGELPPQSFMKYLHHSKLDSELSTYIE